MSASKKSCCGCFGLFKEKKPKPRTVEICVQTDNPLMLSSRITPLNNLKAFSDSHFYPRVRTPEIPAVPRLRTMIVTGHNMSSTFYQESREESIQTPIVHHYQQEDPPIEKSVPQVFENARNKLSSRGMPQLAPVTPARGYRVKSQVIKNATSVE